MKLTDFQNEVARRVDTDKTKINVSETKRVLSEAFLVLAELDAADAIDTFSKGINGAAKKLAKK